MNVWILVRSPFPQLPIPPSPYSCLSIMLNVLQPHLPVQCDCSPSPSFPFSPPHFSPPPPSRPLRSYPPPPRLLLTFLSFHYFRHLPSLFLPSPHPPSPTLSAPHFAIALHS